MALPDRVRAAFPSAQVIALGGATEAAIWSNFFPVGEVGATWTSIPYGRPIQQARYHVLDAHFEPNPIGVPGDLYIAGPVLASGYAAEPILTASKFVPDPFVGPAEAGVVMYRTGDRARYLADGNLEFLGRVDFQVKIRGFRIELGEIESTLAQHPAVREAAVIARETGFDQTAVEKRLVAYVVFREGAPEPTVGELRDFVQSKLPEYMVPSAFVALPELPVTANGKLDRKALPAPEQAARPALGSAFAHPRNETERALAGIWQELLRVERVGIHDNFFELGGDSILSIQLISRAARDGIHLTARQVFQSQTVAELAVAAVVGGVFAEQGPVVGEVAPTAIDRWFFALDLPAAHHWNQSVLLDVMQPLDQGCLAGTVEALFEHHDVLRSRFDRIAEGPESRRRLDPPGPSRAFSVLDLAPVADAGRTAALEAALASLQGSLDLAAGPVARVVLFRMGEGRRDKLFVVAHHLAIDGVSWRILIEDLETAYGELQRGGRIELPPKTTSMREWAGRLGAYANGEALAAEIPFWAAMAGEIAPIPVDLDRAENRVADAGMATLRLDEEETRALLQDVPAVYRTQINDVLVAGFARAWAAWAGTPRLRFDLEGHGREEFADDLDISRTVGWFTAIHPVAIDLTGATAGWAGPGEALKIVKETLRAIPNRGFGFGPLRHLRQEDAEGLEAIRRVPPSEISFNYLGQLDQALPEVSRFAGARESAGPERAPEQPRTHLLDVIASVSGHRLEIAVAFGQRVHRRASIERLLAAFRAELLAIVEHCREPEAGGVTPSDFPLAALAAPDLDRALAELPGVHPREIEDLYPLSPLQQGLLFHTLEATEGMYAQQLRVTLQGPLDLPAFERAWQRVLDRHPIFRTGFLWRDLDRPLQVVRRGVRAQIDVFDWSERSAEERRGADDFLIREGDQPFDLVRGPLVRFALVKLGPQTYRFAWLHHHLVLDGWSMPMVLNEVMAFYQGEVAGQEIDLPRPRPFRDYIAWLERQDTTAAEPFFRERLGAVEHPTAITSGLEGEALALGEDARGDLETELPAELSGALEAFARSHQITVNTLLQGAWSILLSRYSGDRRVVYGSTVAGRPAELAGVESMVGMFINTLPVAVEVAGETPLADWLRALQAEQAEMRQFEHVPLVTIQGWSGVPRGVPLFESVLVYENYPFDRSSGGERSEVGGLALQDGAFSFRTPYPLMWVAKPGARLVNEIIWDRRRFERAAIERLAGHLEALLAGMAGTDGDTARVGDLPLLAAAERAQLAAWNATAAELAPAWGIACLHEMFERQADATPGAVAVQGADASLTYGELEARANRLARRLRRLGAAPDEPIGVCFERSLEMTVAVLAALKAGGAYVPFDPGYPRERLALMAEDSGLRFLLTAGSAAAALPALPGVIVVDLGIESVDRESAERIPVEESGAGPESLAYVLYTSGSTGRPKGVAMRHGALVNLMAWQLGRSRPALRTLQFSSLSFDVSCQELFATWASGGTLHLVTQEVRRNPEALLLQLAEQRIERLFLPFVALQQLAEVAIDRGPLPDSLVEVDTAGEQLQSTASLVEMFRRLPAARLHNQYGPTEAHVVSAHDLPPEPGAWERLPPIGAPIANLTLHVHDREQQTAPVGIVGELLIGGAGLARGYLARPDFTAEKFIPEAGGALAGARLYRTGDLARRRADGEIDFLGRADGQVKIRGFRVEPGEVEALLAGHPAVREAVVVARGAAPGSRELRLVAYVVFGEERAVPAAELARHLAERLPEHMVPAAFVALPALPLTPSGKVDRRALPAPEATGLEPAGALAPRTPIEEVAAGVWAEVLGLGASRRVGRGDNFFALGGHSLIATQVVSRLRRLLGVEVAISLLFETPDLASFAAGVEQSLVGETARMAPPLLPVPRDGRLVPLSFAQQRFWFLEQLDSRSAAYNIVMPMQLDGPVRVDLLEAALAEVVRRHEALRTAFVWADGRPVQAVAEAVTVRVPVVDLSHLPEVGRDAAAHALVRRAARRPFDLTRPSQLRPLLIRLNAGRNLLVIVMHHLITDLWSIDILLREMTTLYGAFALGRRSPLPELAVQYADYAVWQRDWLVGEALDAQLDYWRGELAGIPAGIELPIDKPRPPAQTFPGARRVQRLPAELSAAVRRAGGRHGATLYMTLLAAFQALLARLTGQDDVVVGSPIAGRTREETEPLIGLFVNTLVLRGRVGGDPDLAALLAAARRSALGAYAHQDLPFEMLVDALDPERDMRRNPLFQILFVLQNMPAAEEPRGEGRMAISTFPLDEGVAKFELNVSHVDQGAEMTVEWEYNTDLFEAVTIGRMQRWYLAALAAVAQSPETRISEIPLLDAAERHQLLAGWNDPDASFPAGLPLHRRFEAQAARRPQAPAVIHDLDQLSYGELNRRANRLARRLIALGVNPGDRVGLCLERSLDLIVGLLGILKTGAAYLPLDPAYPAERLAFLLADGGARVAVTTEPLLARLAELGSGGLAAVCLDRDAAALAAESAEDLVLAGAGLSEATAYVIYTSGSTGRPKGVEVSHAQVDRLFTATDSWFGFGERDVWTMFHSFAFDFSVWEIWGALLHGGQLVVVPYETSRSPKAFLDLLRTEGVTVLNQTPSAFRQLLGQAEASGLPALARLRFVIFGGEALDVPALAPWFAHFAASPAAPVLVNMYGITETTVHVTWRPITAADLRRRVSVIGVPIPDLQVHLVDRHGNLVPVGVAGEMLVGGAGVARGYLGRPDLTAQRFVPDPWSSLPGARLYRSGDLARRGPNGELEYLGRGDHQVKIRGFRIELEEIEAELSRHPGVGECTVQALGAGDDRRLVAYLVASPERPLPSAAELREHLAARLPEPMMPSAFVILDALPLGPTGKLDRRALPAPEAAGLDARLKGSEYVAPRSPAERLLATLMAEVLGCERVGARDDFFALGGHSLLATRLLGRLREVAQVDLPLRELFEAPSVEALAAVIERRWVAPAAAGALAALPAIVPAPELRYEPFPLTDLQQAYWIGHTGAYELGEISPHSYQEIEFPALDLERLAGAWRRLVARHDALRLEILPDGRQRIREPRPELLARLRPEVFDLRGASEPEAAARLLEIRGRMSEEGPRLDGGPLWQLAASLLPPELGGGVRLHISLSLLACDARSFRILARELTRLYIDPAAELPPLEDLAA